MSVKGRQKVPPAAEATGDDPVVRARRERWVRGMFKDNVKENLPEVNITWNLPFGTVSHPQR